uniref:Uncharacterized protein n=1 Tax=Daphnia magna TaxID=35525 RepID=A0A0P6GYY8_9CRUS
MARVEELKNNMVHFKDNVTANGTVVIAQMNFSQSPVIGTIKVLYNFSEEFVTPKKIKSVEELLDIAAKKHLPRNTKSCTPQAPPLLRVVYVSMVQYCIINGLDYDEFSRQAWRYSSLEHTDLHHVWIGGLKAGHVSVGSLLEDHCPRVGY